MIFRHGLLIGKFYPPHLGHHAAIRAGARDCIRMSVVVMSAAGESIPLADRVAWLQAEHAGDENVRVVGVPCDAPLDITDQTVWAAQVAVMRAALRMVTPEPVDAVYSADDYGAELADWFGATHVRTLRLPSSPSSSAVRRDLAGSWDVIGPATRAALATRVIVLGAESTGTTTVAQSLASIYQERGGVWARTRCVGEYGREYTDLKWTAARSARLARGLDELVWTAEDFDVVAWEQTRRENEAVVAGSPLLVCDTDAFATAIWERRYLGSVARRSPPWASAPELPRRQLYLLTDHAGVAWDDDGMREGDLEIRTAMTEWFADALTAAGHSWVLLTGTLDERVDLARRTVDQLLGVRMRFAPPLDGPGFDHEA